MAQSEQSRWKVVLIAFTAIAVPFVVNEWFGEAIHENKFLQVLTPGFWYRHLGPGMPIRSRVHEFRIVTISRGVEDPSALGENRCSHRAFMAKLLNKIAEDPTVNPRLIVLDKWYNHVPPGACSTNPDSTEELRTAIQKLSAKVSIVIALASYNREEVKQFCGDKVNPELVKPEEMVIADYQRFDLPAEEESSKRPQNRCQQPAGKIRFGLARANLDIRKVPLGWLVFCDCDQVKAGQSHEWPTLATVAADMLDPSIMQGRDLAKLKQEVHHPYIQLLAEEPAHPEESFGRISAKSLVEGRKDALEELNHRIVIIGEPWTDTHKTDDGFIDGPTLQANYIAALLSETTLKPVNIWLRRVISLGWLGVIFSIFYCWKRTEPRPLVALIVSLFLTCFVAVFFSIIITRQLGIFPDVIPPTILEIIGLYLARNIELMLEPRH